MTRQPVILTLTNIFVTTEDNDQPHSLIIQHVHMAPKYTSLPTDPSYSPSLRPDTPSYPPPYESTEEEHQRLSFSQDIEEDAPRRARVRREPLPAYDSDPRFRLPTPSPYARAGLLVFLFGMFWLAFVMRKAVWVAGGRGGMNKDAPEVDPSY